MLLGLAAGCTVHRSRISQWHFYDRQTGQPVDRVLLLEWIEKEHSRSPEAQAFEQQVPSRAALADLRWAELSIARPQYRPGTTTKIQGYAMTVSERPRFMAIRDGYSFRATFASQEQLAILGVESAGDESYAYVLLDSRVDAAAAVDWLGWLTNGRQLIAHLPWQQRRKVYEAFAAYWDRALADPGPLSAELETRPGQFKAELERIYREELAARTTAAE